MRGGMRQLGNRARCSSLTENEMEDKVSLHMPTYLMCWPGAS